MHLRTGIPLLSDVDALLQQDEFRQHAAYNEEFLKTHERLLRRYSRRWRENPLRLWSRRWEYPYTAQAIQSFVKEQGETPLKILDAGSGVTYFPYFLCRRIPDSEVICCDSNPAYGKIFDAINCKMQRSSVSFIHAMLQDLPLESQSLDVVYCVSVLEHTNAYGKILDEFKRVLRPDGLFVLTFDLSLDGQFCIPRDRARELLALIDQRFKKLEGLDYQSELGRLDRPTEILTTDHVRDTEPALLPWKFPLAKAIKDLLTGHGWSGGFHSLSCYCLAARTQSKAA